MTLKDRTAKQLKKLLDLAKDEKVRKQVKEEVKRRLAQGKAAMVRLKAELNKPETRARAAEQIKRAKTAYAHLKTETVKRERQAVAYAQKNPEKALVLAAAAGAAAGALLLAIRNKVRA